MRTFQKHHLLSAYGTHRAGMITVSDILEAVVQARTVRLER
jgi:hypothetical protein